MLWFFQGSGGDSQRCNFCSNASPVRESQRFQPKIATLKMTDVLTCLCRLRLAVSFLIHTQTPSSSCFIVAYRTYRGHPGDSRPMPCRLNKRILTIRYSGYKPSKFLTVHDHRHILNKTVNNLKCLRRGDPSLILGESIQSLDYRFDVLLSKKLLNKFFCVSLRMIEPGNIVLQRRTHSLSPLGSVW